MMPDKSSLRLKPDDSRDFYSVVLKRAEHVGRIFKSNSAPRDLPWLWTVKFSERRGEGPHQGYQPTREAAMAAFRAAWEAQQK